MKTQPNEPPGKRSPVGRRRLARARRTEAEAAEWRDGLLSDRPRGIRRPPSSPAGGPSPSYPGNLPDAGGPSPSYPGSPPDAGGYRDVPLFPAAGRPEPAGSAPGPGYQASTSDPGAPEPPGPRETAHQVSGAPVGHQADLPDYREPGYRDPVGYPAYQDPPGHPGPAHHGGPPAYPEPSGHQDGGHFDDMPGYPDDGYPADPAGTYPAGPGQANGFGEGYSGGTFLPLSDYPSMPDYPRPAPAPAEGEYPANGFPMTPSYEAPAAERGPFTPARPTPSVQPPDLTAVSHDEYSYPGEDHPEPYPAEPYPAEPYPAEPYPAEPYPDEEPQEAHSHDAYPAQAGLPGEPGSARQPSAGTAADHLAANLATVRAQPDADTEDAHWAVLAYLTAPVFGPVLPLAAYLRGLRRSGWLRAHAAQAVNTWLTGLLYDVSALIVAGMLALDSTQVAALVVGPALVCLWLVILAQLIRAARAAGRGEEYTIPRWLCSPMLR